MTIAPTSAAASALTPPTDNTRVPVQVLGQADFLKLLVTQLTTQDPLNPTKDTEFIAQMAQFSSLEQTKAMQQSLAALRHEQQFLQAQSLLGQTVDLQINADTAASGIVTAVQIDAGTPKLVVNGQMYDLNQVLMVTPTPAPVTQ